MALRAPRSVETSALSLAWSLGHQAAKVPARAGNPGALGNLPARPPISPRRQGTNAPCPLDLLGNASPCGQVVSLALLPGGSTHLGALESETPGNHVTCLAREPCNQHDALTNLVQRPCAPVGRRGNQPWQVAKEPVPPYRHLRRALCPVDEETPYRDPSAGRSQFLQYGGATQEPRFLGVDATSVPEKPWNVEKKERCFIAQQGNMEATEQRLQPAERAPAAAQEQAAAGVGEGRGTAWLGPRISAARRPGSAFVRAPRSRARDVAGAIGKVAEQGRAPRPRRFPRFFC